MQVTWGVLRSIATVTTGEYKPLAMNGKEVYKFATTCVPQVLGEALGNAGITADDVDWLLLHQVGCVHQNMPTANGPPPS